MYIIKTKINIIMVAISVVLQFMFVSIVNAQSYRAGVVAYKPLDINAETTEAGHLKSNSLSYVDVIRNNVHQVDLLVFPEFGLTNIVAKNKTHEELYLYSAKIGNVQDLICAKRSQDNLARISCAAQENNILVVLNLIEREERPEIEGEKTDYNYYLTAIGLDQNGTLGFKCRQFQLPNNSVFDNDPNQTLCRFNATFKNNAPVPLTIMFGSDLVYKFPTELNNTNVIVMSSARNVFPLNVAPSLYQGFAVSNAVNLLVSGYYEPNSSDFYGGTGIFFSNGTSIVTYKPDGSDDVGGRATVIKAEFLIKSIPQAAGQSQSQIVGSLPILDFPYMNISGLNSTNKSEESCIDPKKCCKFQTELAEDSISPYRWMIFSNKTVILDHEVGIFVCALVAPSANAVPKTFKNLSITSTLDKSRINQNLSYAIGENLLPVNYEFTCFNHSVESVIKLSQGNVLVFGILQIVVNDVVGPSPSIALLVLISLLCTILVCLLIVYIIWKNRQAKSKRTI